MPQAYSLAATKPLTRQEGHSILRACHTATSDADDDLVPASPAQSSRPRFLRTHSSPNKRDPASNGGKIPWDEGLVAVDPFEDSPPVKPGAGRQVKSEEAVQGGKRAHRVQGSASSGESSARVFLSPVSAARAGLFPAGGLYGDDSDEENTARIKVSPSKGRSGLKRLVNKGSKFSLRHLGRATIQPSPPSSPQSQYGFEGTITAPAPLTPPSASIRLSPATASSRGDGRKGSSAGLSMDESSRAGGVKGKAAKILGEEIVPHGKAARLLGLERKRTLVKRPSTTSLQAPKYELFPRSDSSSPSLRTASSGTARLAPPIHVRQRSISTPAPVFASLDIPISSPELSTSPRLTPLQSEDDDPWQPLVPTSAPVTPDTSPELAKSTRNKTRELSHSSSVESFPQTARIASYASSTFRDMPDFRASGMSRYGSTTGRLSPDSIRFSSLFGNGGFSEPASSNDSPGESVAGPSRPGSIGMKRVSGLTKMPSVGARGVSDSSVLSTASAPVHHPLPPIPDVTTLELAPVPASAPVTPITVPSTNPLLTALPAPTSPLPAIPSASSFSTTTPLAPMGQPRPKRTNTLISVASSHTRRRQRTHALEALEGRRKKDAEEEEEEVSGLPVSTERIAELERRALEGVERGERDVGSARGRERGRESRPFLDLAWSSDEEEEREPKPMLARRSRRIARDEVVPPVPALPKWPPPVSPLPSPPGLGIDGLASTHRGSPTSSSSASDALTIPAPVAHSAPRTDSPTSRPAISRRASPPRLPSLPPLPQLPYSAPPTHTTTPAPLPPLPSPPQHLRQTSKTSLDSSRSMLSLSSDEEDGASVWEETTRAFPKPPGHGVIAAG
ncbi:hypothetical protein NBRC10512_002597 [Rhodotorula toruloides]|uniref:RHTO0S17e02014g1_1 n=2 Tax=Rhodotorula toruloides TaxID=5286 RepID=A0A061BG69_RHOTO|nr:uncharacterized protein RHTO_03388 [Rhodotorula toruloides NP11]EMS20469.1 hypothetical protein RHTO_03388 [Rhodotorula toruloides NP11]CDR48362.1 RHTO0S17e02014g1_1 [Rhodotorula toruloides]